MKELILFLPAENTEPGLLPTVQNLSSSIIHVHARIKRIKRVPAAAAKKLWLRLMMHQLQFIWDGPTKWKTTTKTLTGHHGLQHSSQSLKMEFFLALTIFKKTRAQVTWFFFLIFFFLPFVLSFSGLIVPESRSNETVPEVVTTSGYALLHFFSDAAYNLTGFNIAYS